MYVIKRNGKKEDVSFDKILCRIKTIAEGLDGVDCVQLSQKVIERLYPSIKTTELDDETAKIASNLETTHLDYGIIASRILVSNLHKNTDKFSDAIKELYFEGNISDYMYYFVYKYGDIIDNKIDYSRDYSHDYFGLKTLEKLYLLKNNNQKIVERPQHMWMRVALSIFREDILGQGNGIDNTNLLQKYTNIKTVEKYVLLNKTPDGNEHRERIIETHIQNINLDALHSALEEKYEKNINIIWDNIFELYDSMSKHLCTQATPTLFNAGTRRESFISCYLQDTKSDTIKGMYDTINDISCLFQSTHGIGTYCVANLIL